MCDKVPWSVALRKANIWLCTGHWDIVSIMYCDIGSTVYCEPYKKLHEHLAQHSMRDMRAGCTYTACLHSAHLHPYLHTAFSLAGVYEHNLKFIFTICQSRFCLSLMSEVLCKSLGKA